MKTPTTECAFDKMVATGELKPNPRNPNKHPKKQIELLAKIIKAQGWRAPITVSTRSGFIVRGHARLEAAKLLGLTECPVDFQDYASEAVEWADCIADNRLSELSDIDLPSIKDLLLELDTGALDMDLTGYDAESIEQLMAPLLDPNAEWQGMPEVNNSNLLGYKQVVIHFKNKTDLDNFIKLTNIKILHGGAWFPPVKNERAFNKRYSSES